jgi:hypothetical protein
MGEDEWTAREPGSVTDSVVPSRAFPGRAFANSAGRHGRVVSRRPVGILQTKFD